MKKSEVEKAYESFKKSKVNYLCYDVIAKKFYKTHKKALKLLAKEFIKNSRYKNRFEALDYTAVLFYRIAPYKNSEFVRPIRLHFLRWLIKKTL
jgi:hypothetical protein